MSNCPTCRQSLNGSFTAATVDLLVDWDEFDYLAKGDYQYVPMLGDVVVMDIKTGEQDSYGYVIESEAYVVIKVGEQHFRKEGERSSYGGLEWNGECREVKGEPRTVTVYDFV